MVRTHLASDVLLGAGHVLFYLILTILRQVLRSGSNPRMESWRLTVNRSKDTRTSVSTLQLTAHQDQETDLRSHSQLKKKN